MDVSDFLNYHTWADSLIIELLKQVSDSDFTQTSNEIRSIRDLIEHYLSSYDYLVFPSDKIRKREIDISEMPRNQIMTEISKSHQKFREIVLKFDPEIPLRVGNGESIPLDKDNYLLIFLDHLTYHRGQITHAIKSKGYKGVNTDYYDYQEKFVMGIK